MAIRGLIRAREMAEGWQQAEVAGEFVHGGEMACMREIVREVERRCEREGDRRRAR